MRGWRCSPPRSSGEAWTSSLALIPATVTERQRTMKIACCRQNPNALLCEKEQLLPLEVGSYVELAGVFHQVRRVEHLAREAIAYVMPN